MTAENSVEEILRKCFTNLYDLSSRQVEYIKQDDLESLLEILHQKQVIINFIAGLDLTSLQVEESEKEKLKDIINKTEQLNSECRGLLQSKELSLLEKIRLVTLKEYNAHTTLKKAFLDEKI